MERYLAPRDGSYTSLTTHGRGESIHPERFPDMDVALDAILPR